MLYYELVPQQKTNKQTNKKQKQQQPFMMITVFEKSIFKVKVQFISIVEENWVAEYPTSPQNYSICTASTSDSKREKPFFIFYFMAEQALWRGKGRGVSNRGRVPVT